MSGLLVPSAFGVTEELIHGSSSLELLPAGITPGNPISFEIKFQYTEGPYALDNFVPVIEINPASARDHVKIDVKPTGVTQGQIVRIPVTLTIDPQIDHEKVFLSISFTGDHFSSRSDATYKSAWIESAIIDIVQSDVLSLGLLVPEPSPTCPDGIIVKNNVCVVANVNTDCGEGTTYQDGICVVDEMEISTESFSNRWGGPSYTYDVESPLKQFKSGIVIDEIQCKEFLVLMEKYDGSPSCVKKKNFEKLIQRNWGQQISYNNLVMTDAPSEIYLPGMPISFKVTETGWGNPCNSMLLSIINLDTDEIVWNRSEIHPCFSNPKDDFFTHVSYVPDSRVPELFFEEIGDYQLNIESRHETLEYSFSVKLGE